MASISVVTTRTLDPSARGAVLELADRIATKQRRDALSEQARDRIEAAMPALHFLARSGGSLVGYALGVESSAGFEVEFLGDRLEATLLDAVCRESLALGGSLELWIRGRLAVQEAPKLFKGRLDRTILRLRRPLGPRDSAPESGALLLRSFDPDRDVEPWLELNRRVFAHHPEQGSVGASDLARKMAASWFEPSGFFVVETKEDLVGFSWTKIHRRPWMDVGEIYAIGVDADASGKGIGTLLLEASFAWLRSQGLDSVMLYCEIDNDPALALYRRLGFTEEWRDECWILDV
jgi:mycothiol synthase